MARWIDHDKGDRYRCRWVAKQFKSMDNEEWFAATPPLEALRAVLSYATTGGANSGFLVNDASRAFFYAPVQHDIFVGLCDEMKRGAGRLGHGRVVDQKYVRHKGRRPELAK